MKIRFIILNIIAILMSIVFVVTAFAVDTTVTTLAGKGEPYFKDGELMNAYFNQPYGMVVDSEGNLIIADTYNNRIRKITQDEVITIAGTSVGVDDFGFPQGGMEDGAASEAQFNRPRDIAINSKGELFVADTENNIIRKISEGKVSTFCGTGVAGLKDGKCNEARFNAPSGIAIDQEDNIYVADTLNNVIRVIDSKGEVSTLTFETGEQYYNGVSLNEPSDIVFDAKNTLYIVDSGNQMIKKVVDGKIYRVAGANLPMDKTTGYRTSGFRDSVVLDSTFNFPKGITVCDNGVVLIADTWNHAIRAVKPDGRVITIAGTGKAGSVNGDRDTALFNAPVALAYSNNTLYISDMWNNCIKKITLDFGSSVFDLDKRYALEGIELLPASNEPQIWINKIMLAFEDNKPFFQNNSTYLPLADTCEQLGAEISFDPIQQKYVIIYEGKTIEYSINSDKLLDKNGIKNIYIRQLAKDMGLFLTWVEEHKAVLMEN